MVNEGVPQIIMFFCSNCLDREEIGEYCATLGVDERRAISLPCSGKVNIEYLIKAFETGCDGVVVLTCELDTCRHLEGNRRAKKRAQAVDSLLQEIGMGAGRIAVVEVKEGEHEQTMHTVKAFCAKLEQIGTGDAVKTAG